LNSLKNPALLIKISNRPNTFSISFATLSTFAWFATSTFSFKTFGAFFPAARAAEWISVSMVVKSERAPRAMPFAPALAHDIAVSYPTPLEAPVI
jgi:hypothetical protein